MKRITMVLCVVLASLTPSCKSEAQKRKAALASLCARAEAIGCSEAMQSVDPVDRRRVLVAELCEQTPALESFFAEVVKFPVEKRVEAIRDIATRDTGAPWSCVVWEKVDEDPCPGGPKK